MFQVIHRRKKNINDSFPGFHTKRCFDHGHFIQGFDFFFLFSFFFYFLLIFFICRFILHILFLVPVPDVHIPIHNGW